MTKKIVIEKAKSLPDEYQINSDVICIVQNRLVSKLGGRKNWIRILNTENNKKIYRLMQGSGDIKDHSIDLIRLNYDSRISLGIQTINSEKVNLILSKTNLFEKIIANLRHPDIKYSIPLIISLISLFLGFVSLTIAFIK